MELADVVKSLRLHWRFSVASILLGVVGLALFLVTRNQVRPANRYQVTVDVLVPNINSQTGARPAGVPPSLLVGQNRQALKPQTEKAALDAAKVAKADRRSIGFLFHAAPNSDTINIGASAHDPKVASAVAIAFEHAYVATRRDSIGSGSKNAANGATAALGVLTNRLAQVKSDLKKADPKLLARLPNNAGGGGQQIANNLSVETPIKTVLLVVEHQELLSRILAAEISYAQDAARALLPGSFAETIEVNSPTQITPPLPSSTVPSAAFLGIGLLLALVAPILIDRLDHSIRSAKTAAVAFDSIVLTSVPAATRRVQRSLALPGTPLDGAYRALAATAIATDRLPEAIVVTSPTGSMQDTVAANFAAALAGLGLRVALIATDARQSWFLDTRTDPESTGVALPELLDLAHRGALNGALPNSLVKTSLDKLFVLPPGEEDSEVRLDGLRPLLEKLSTSDVDVTVIAGPSVLEDPNATILAWTTRSVLWAFETGEVTEAEAKEAASRIALAGASSFGIAMVNAKT